jgi:hypothetical protein
VVSTTPRPLYPQERPGTHYTGGWVGPKAGLDVCEKSSPSGIFLYLIVSCASLFWYWTFNGRFYRIVLHAVDFSSSKNPTTSVRSEPAILGTRGQHANP